MSWTEDLADVERDGRRIIGLGRGAPERIVQPLPPLVASSGWCD